MDPSTFSFEDEKYSALWISGYSDAHWKRLARTALRFASSEKPIVDFGFGKGSALDYFESHGFPVEGIEISSYAVAEQRKKGRKIYHTSLDDLSMIADDCYTLGFCNDVLEHLPEHVITAALDEMARVCSDYLFVSVCPTPSHHLSLKGENLHLTVQPISWWEERLERYGTLEQLKLFLSRSARYIIHLTR